MIASYARYLVVLVIECVLHVLAFLEFVVHLFKTEYCVYVCMYVCMCMHIWMYGCT